MPSEERSVKVAPFASGLFFGQAPKTFSSSSVRTLSRNFLHSFRSFGIGGTGATGTKLSCMLDVFSSGGMLSKTLSCSGSKYWTAGLSMSGGGF